MNADFYPTLANLIGAKTSHQILDGTDLSELLLSNAPIENRALFWHFPIYLQAYSANADQSQDPLFRTRPGTAMRKGQWKLIHFLRR